jgi:hypothetical protein
MIMFCLRLHYELSSTYACKTAAFKYHDRSPWRLSGRRFTAEAEIKDPDKHMIN